MSRIESNDVVLSKNLDGVFDITFDDEGDILTNDFLDTSLLRTIYGQRRALPSEVPISDRRRGWIGSVTRVFEDGSKIWLYEQSPLNRTTINGVRSEIVVALSWLIEFDAALSYDVNVFIDNTIQMTAEISIQRSTSRVDNRFYKLFENSGVS